LLKHRRHSIDRQYHSLIETVKLIQHGTVATILLGVAGLSLVFSFGWPIEAGLRVIAFLGSGVWMYALVAQLFLIQAHTQGEINASLNRWHMTLPAPAQGVGRGVAAAPLQLLEGEVLTSGVERLVPVHTTAPQITPVVVTSTAQRMIELPDGRKLPREDVVAFVDGLDVKGHMRKDWIGFRAPSGKVVDSVYFQSLIGAVRVAGEFQKYGQGIRSVRSLPTSEIKQRLHLD